MKLLEKVPGLFNGPSPVCGESEFGETYVLWSDLIEAWQLKIDEVIYINRQQALHCGNCGNNLRSMALAAAVLSAYCYDGTFD